VTSTATRVLRLALMAGLAVGCDRPAQPPGSAGDAEISREADRTSGLLQEVMEADRDFAAAVAEGGVDAWVAAFAEDGSMIPASGPVVTGHEAIREMMTPAFGTPGFVLKWEPQGGEVATSGDLAYTFGEFESRSDAEAPVRGRYVTVWRLGGAGRWEVIADIGTREQIEESEEAG